MAQEPHWVGPFEAGIRTEMQLASQPAPHSALSGKRALLSHSLHLQGGPYQSKTAGRQPTLGAALARRSHAQRRIMQWRHELANLKHQITTSDHHLRDPSSCLHTPA